MPAVLGAGQLRYTGKTVRARGGGDWIHEPIHETLLGFEPMVTITQAAQDVILYTKTSGRYLMKLQQVRSIRRASRGDMLGGSVYESSITECRSGGSRRSGSSAACSEATYSWHGGSGFVS